MRASSFFYNFLAGRTAHYRFFSVLPSLNAPYLRDLGDSVGFAVVGPFDGGGWNSFFNC